MSLYSTGTVHVYCTHRPVHSRADGPVWCEPRREKHDPWGVNYNKPTDENKTLTCDTTVKNWESISIKTKKTFSKIGRRFVSYSAVLSLWANIVQKFASCMQNREAEQPRQSLQHPAASLHYTTAILSVEVIFIKYWETFQHQHHLNSECIAMAECWDGEYDLWSVIKQWTSELHPPRSMNSFRWSSGRGWNLAC